MKFTDVTGTDEADAELALGRRVAMHIPWVPRYREGTKAFPGQAGKAFFAFLDLGILVVRRGSATGFRRSFAYP